MKRLLTALILGPFIVAVVLWGPPYLFLPVLSIIALLCFWEYTGIVAGYGIEPPGPVAYAAGLIVLLARQDPALVLTLSALLLLSFTLSFGDLRRTLPSAAAAGFGLLYIFGAWRAAILLRAINPYWLLFALALNWLADAAAYYTGIRFGRHKLAPRISPGKSWEGSIASLAAGLVFAVVYLRLLIPTVPLWQALLLGAAGNLAGQLGDLAESALKRGANVKDSGTMLPGHGGWLDRVDSALFAQPVIYALLVLVLK